MILLLLEINNSFQSYSKNKSTPSYLLGQDKKMEKKVSRVMYVRKYFLSFALCWHKCEVSFLREDLSGKKNA